MKTKSKRSNRTIQVCHDCKQLIIPPLGKPFGNGDGKIRCASCAVDFYMKQPGALITFENESIEEWTK